MNFLEIINSVKTNNNTFKIEECETSVIDIGKRIIGRRVMDYLKNKVTSANNVFKQQRVVEFNVEISFDGVWESLQHIRLDDSFKEAVRGRQIQRLNNDYDNKLYEHLKDSFFDWSKDCEYIKNELIHLIKTNKQLHDQNITLNSFRIDYSNCVDWEMMFYIIGFKY